jgi:ABC-type amino acid transport substrate-binding protein
VTGIADLVGKRVGVQRGSTGERLAKRIFRAEVFSYDSIGQAFGVLEEGAVHAVLNDHPTSELYISGGGPARIAGGIVERERYAAAFRKSDANLKQRFDSALTAFMVSPRFDQLLLRYRLNRATGR